MPKNNIAQKKTDLKQKYLNSPFVLAKNWISDRIDPFFFGRSSRQKTQFAQTTKSAIEWYYNQKSSGKNAWLKRISDHSYLDHFNNVSIIYFVANWRQSCPEVLIMLDIDCHEKGTIEGANDCVNWIKENGFPTLFHSVSTNGRGIHAYFILKKEESSAEVVIETLNRLESWLKRAQKSQNWDISDVEIKGKPPVLKFARWPKFQLESCKHGQLAKIPVEAMERLTELKATTCLSLDDCNVISGSEIVAPTLDFRGCASDAGTLRVPAMALGEGTIPDHGLAPSKRNREWPLWCEFIAKKGLQQEDSLAEVVRELAIWLYFVEWYGESTEKIAKCLKSWILKKHNGKVTRIMASPEEVLSQVDRIVASVPTIKFEKSKEIFTRIRSKRKRGQYRRIISIGHLLAQEPESEPETVNPYYSCTSLVFLNKDPELPPKIQEKITQIAQTNGMRRIKGEYPLVKFAEVFLGFLWANHGQARLSAAKLKSWVNNDVQNKKFRNLLREAVVIEEWAGTHRSGKAASLYLLTTEAKEIFESHFLGKNQSKTA